MPTCSAESRGADALLRPQRCSTAPGTAGRPIIHDIRADGRTPARSYASVGPQRRRPRTTPAGKPSWAWSGPVRASIQPCRATPWTGLPTHQAGSPRNRLRSPQVRDVFENALNRAGRTWRWGGYTLAREAVCGADRRSRGIATPRLGAMREPASRLPQRRAERKDARGRAGCSWRRPPDPGFSMSRRPGPRAAARPRTALRARDPAGEHRNRHPCSSSSMLARRSPSRHWAYVHGWRPGPGGAGAPRRRAAAAWRPGRDNSSARTPDRWRQPGDGG